MSRTRAISGRIAATTAATVTCGLVALAAPAHATSSIGGGAISPSEMMTRAQYWVNQAVPYNQSNYHTDSSGTNYREDCSGFISMAWHLSKSLIVTDPAPDDFTNTDGTPNTNYDTGIGAFTNLQTGDAMAYPHDHIFLFDTWTNKSTGAFTYYAESNPSDPTHGPTAANINSSTIEGWPTGGYVGLRYKNVTSSAATSGHASTLQGDNTVISFKVASDGNIYESHQTSTTGGFTAFTMLSVSGGQVGAPVSARSSANGGTVYAFARTANGHIGVFNQSTANGAFSSGAYVGATSPVFAGDPTVTTAQNGTLVVFAVDTNGDLWEINQTAVGGGWGTWVKLSTAGGLVGQPTATLSAANGGTVQVFARTTDGHVAVFGQSSPTSNFSAGSNIGSGSPAAAGNPTVTVNQNGGMIVFALDANGDLWTVSQGGVGYGFGAWSKVSVSGGLVGTPTAAQSSANGGTVYVFARTTDGHIGIFNQSAANGSFSSGAYIGSNSPVLTGDPSVNLATNGTLVVFSGDGAGTQYGINQSAVGSAFGNWWTVGQ